MEQQSVSALFEWAGCKGKVIRSWVLAVISVALAVPGLMGLSAGVAGILALSLPNTATAALARPNEQINNLNGHWGNFKLDNDNDRDNDKNDRDDSDPKKKQLIVLEEAAVSAWDDGRTVATQVQLRNVGIRRIRDVRVTRITVDGGAYQGPKTLPLLLGNLRGGEDVFFDAVLGLAPINGTPHELTVIGAFSVAGEERKFKTDRTIRPTTALPGPFISKTGQTAKSDPNSALYPPAPPLINSLPNAESPIFVPIGPTRQLFAATPTGTALGTSAGGASVTIPRNTSSANAGVPPDPNAAAAAPNGVVLSTYNTGLSFSTDGGATFTDVGLTSPVPGNPTRTSFFPQSDGGLCCDQVVVYLQKQNLFVWLLQYQPVLNAAGTAITSPDRLRIAWAAPAAIAANFYNAWSYADLTGTNVAGVSSGLGIAANEWLDYPDLAWSDTFLYVGVDHGFPTPGQVYTGRRIVARMNLAQMADAASPSVSYNFAELTGSNGLNKTHFIQGAPGRMVVGSLDNSSTLRMFTWADDSNSIPSSTIGISSITQGANYTSTAQDGSDWLAVSFPGNITGGTFRNVSLGLGGGVQQQYLFAFDAGVNAGSGRPRAFVRIETLTPKTSGSTDYSAIAEYDSWNTDYAYAMAALGSDGNEIGMTVAVGSGTIPFPQEAVGYRNDFVLYQVTSSNATQGVRFGDYFSTRLIPGDGLHFATEVYDVLLGPLPAGVLSGTCATVGCTARMRYVEFGRPETPPIVPPR